jgi:hypothetical protein
MKIAAIVMVIVSGLALCVLGFHFVLEFDIKTTQEERAKFEATATMLEKIAEAQEAAGESDSKTAVALMAVRLQSIRYLMILLGLASLVAVFMLNRLKLVAVGLLFAIPVLLAFFVPYSLAMTFPLAIGAILAWFVVRKANVPVHVATA